MKKVLIIIFLIFTLASILLLQKDPSTLNINGQSLPIELATTPAEHVKGLKNTARLNFAGHLRIGKRIMR